MSVIERPTYMLEPGYIYLSTSPVVIQTVLGNCVSVCLWDKVKKTGAMNHFLYPFTQDKSKATSAYGNVATMAVLRMMKDTGSAREHLVAHILGGAVPPEDRGHDIGLRNAESAEKVLKQYQIEILSEDTGGTVGRKVVFDTATGHVAVLKVHNLRKSDWYQENNG